MSELKFEVKDFNPEHIFESGQCFRWTKESDLSYTGIASGKIVNLRFVPETRDGPVGEADAADMNRTQATTGTVILDNADPSDREFWYNYFDLGTDYGLIKTRLAGQDKVVAEAIQAGAGMRILRQDPWETLISFILSANNNIPRIKKCVEALAVNFGEKAGNYRGQIYFNLPTWDVLAQLTVDDLACCRLGYRAKYLIGTAKEIQTRGIHTLEDCIHGLSGVGPKVANCILLFSLAKLQRFPIDVWVRKVMHELYGFDEKDTKGMTAFADRTFGPYAGIAQQYLFYYMRTIKK